MENLNRLKKGINQDVHPSEQPEETYRNAVNFVSLSMDGNAYSLVNEDGTLLLETVKFPIGKQVIGHCVLNNDIIVVLAGEDGTSQIGYIREDSSNIDPDYGYYHPVAPYNPSGATIRDQYPENNSEFGFKLTHGVDCQARKLINGNRVLYYTDNLNPFGRIELENPPEVGNVSEQSQLIFNQQVPTISLKEIREDVPSNIQPGVYQFVPRYVTENGGTTTFGIPSNLISMVPANKDLGVNQYSGEFFENGTISKNIIIDIENIDQNYQELELIVAYYQESGVFQAKSLGRFPITGETLEYTFTGPVTGEEIGITREELQQTPITYKRAKAIEQKDNTLFLSNLSDDTIDDAAMQEVANHISVQYQIEEIPYSGREGTLDTSINTNIFTETAIEITGLNTIEVTFSDEIDLDGSASGNNNIVFDPISQTTSANYGFNDHFITRSGESSFANINTSTVTLGDTMLVDSITFTAVATVANTSTEYLIGGDQEETTENLARAINTDPGGTRNFIAVPFLDGSILKIKLIWKGNDNTKVIAYTGTITGDLIFSGGTSASDIINVTNIEKVSDNILEYTFGSIDRISLIDQFTSIDATKFIVGPQESITVTGTPTLTEDTTTATIDATQEGFTDFLSEKVGFEKKGYRRGEVYSLGIMLLFKDGSTSLVYHIPGNDKLTTTLGKNYPSVANYRVGNTFGNTGTYLSNLEYPLDQFFPGNDTGDDDFGNTSSTSRNIRHHVMPNLTQEPHFRKLNDGTTVIRNIGLKFTLNSSFDIPADILTNVQEIILVRERRNIRINRSVLAQGLINRLVETADTYTLDGQVDGSVSNGVRSNYHLQEIPFFNNLESIDIRGDEYREKRGHSRRGVCYPGASAAESTFGAGAGTFSNGEKMNTLIRGNRAFFHCPESILAYDSKIDPDNLQGLKMRPWMLMEGESFTTSAEPNAYRGTKGNDYADWYGYHDAIGNYQDYDNTYLPDSTPVGTTRTIGDSKDQSAGVTRNKEVGFDTASRPNITSTRWTQGGWEIIVTNTDGTGVTAYDPANPTSDSDHYFPDPGGTKFKVDHEVHVFDKAVTCTGLNGSCYNSAKGGYVETTSGARQTPGSKSVIKNHLYNLEEDNPSQYGNLAQSSFIIAGRFVPKTAGSSYSAYGGDTYITKFSFNTGGILTYYPYDRYKDSSQQKVADTNSRRGYGHIKSGPGGTKAVGYDFRACHYYFVESNINTYYRHTPEEETKQDYFPNQANPSSLLSNFFAYLGNVRSYNGLYSYENNLKEYFMKGSTQQIVSSFENRTIYSEQASSDSVVDSYRNFLVSNYHDIPSHTGPIWDSFVHANNLYLHTPKSCWKTFAEPAATLSAQNITDVVLGTGSLFARPSYEVLTTDGGFAGSISQFGGIDTQMGYMFPDVLQGKIFLLGAGGSGPLLKELSLEGLHTFSHKNMGTGIIKTGNSIDLKNVTTSNAHLIDNPYSGIGYTGGYDYKLKRAWICKQGSLGFTLSYSGLMQSWNSFHSYSPNTIIPFDNRVFFINNNEVSDTTSLNFWEMNKGAKGSYFGTVYDSELELSVPTRDSVVFNNQMMYLDIYNSANLKIRDDFFSKIQVTSDNQNTGLLNFVQGNTFAPTKTDSDIFYKFRNDEYQLAIPRDSVFDNSKDIFDLDNIYQPQGGTVPTDTAYITRKRIKGDYATFKYNYDNTKDNSFVLREIKTIFDKNYR